MFKGLCYLVLITSIGCIPKSKVDQGFLELGPVEESVTPSLNSPAAGYHTKNSSLSFTLTFIKDFTLSGSPQLKLSIADNERLANCSQTASNALECSYVLGSAGIDLSFGEVEVLSYLDNDSTLTVTNENINLKPSINTVMLSGVNTVFENPVLWLDGSDGATIFSNTACSTLATNGVSVRCWRDKFNNQAFINGGSDVPTLVESNINSKNSLFFDFDRLNVSAPITLSTYNAFVVYNVTAWATLNYWIGSISATNPGIGLGFGGTWNGTSGQGIFSLSRNSSNVLASLTSTVEPMSWGIATYNNNQSFRNEVENTPYLEEELMFTSTFSAIGKREDNNACCGHRGHIAEVMIFNTPMSLEEKHKVWCYLSEKYGFNIIGCDG